MILDYIWPSGWQAGIDLLRAARTSTCRWPCPGAGRLSERQLLRAIGAVLIVAGIGTAASALT